MHLSAHVVEVGQKLTGSAPEPGPDTCGGGFTGTPVTWLWDNFPGLTFEAWLRRHGHQTLEIHRRRMPGLTIVDVVGHNWDTHDCGPVTLTAAGNDGVMKPLAVVNASNFTIRGGDRRRLCGLDVVATQAPHRARRARFTRGSAVDLSVMWAKPGVMPGGDVLRPGDVLCRDDLPAKAASDLASGRFDAADANSVASALGQQLIQFASRRVRGAYILADSSGQVGVVGQSSENTPSPSSRASTTRSSQDGTVSHASAARPPTPLFRASIMRTAPLPCKAI